MPERGALAGNVCVDTAVIGGGMAGILTAFYLQRSGVETIVLEAERVGSGQTGHTTAKVTAQHGAVYDRLLGELGEGRSAAYAEANRRAVEEYGRLVREERIVCGWRECSAYCYSTQNRERMEKEARAERQLGFASSFTLETELPFPIEGAVKMEGQACFSPLRFLKALSEGLTVYENSRVLRVEKRTEGGTMLYTQEGCVQAKRVVFATHFPLLKWPGYFFVRMHQERSYVLAVAGAGGMEGMYIGVEEGGLSFRGLEGDGGDLILLGGCGHRTGGNEGGRYERLAAKAERFWPGCVEKARWSAQDCMSLDGVPYIGRFSQGQPSWYVATGFGKWGMSHSMVSALLIRDLILEQENTWEQVFFPSRFASQDVGGLVKNAGCSVKGLVGKARREREIHPEELMAGEGKILRYGDGPVGVCRDEEGKLHLVSARCPHMGCELVWNPDEMSWDCPCHGSRFGYDGRVLDGPAQIGIGLEWR